MFNITNILISAFVFIISLSVHEYSHALASTLQGDKTPEFNNRLTLNPLHHIDIVGFISLIIFRFGWAKPVPINPYNYKNRRLGIIITSLAGPISNLVLAFLSLVILFLVKPQNYNVFLFLNTMVYINCMLAVFNLIPIPPLDGSKVFAELFGGKVAELIYRIEEKGTFILFLLLWIRPVQSALSSVISLVIGFMINVVQLFI